MILANLVAWTMAWLVMRRWLQGFAYRIDMDLGIFLLSGFLALVVALMTVSYQALKAASANPAHSLRHE
jgi:putative ABC transport system permease protein